MIFFFHNSVEDGKTDNILPYRFDIRLNKCFAKKRSFFTHLPL